LAKESWREKEKERGGRAFVVFLFLYKTIGKAN
jgi:hypothetical protein